ncbi:uncharacterized protein VTP21DRAFT_9268 [Calcarisporiella thermophila]|uniref:uncharacterized protein n=1 Tax=Calcarisporiella thermophila TaxID=911321 RepID=UPI003744937C
MPPFSSSTSPVLPPVTRAQRNDLELNELRQSAADTLQLESLLVMHAIAREESPAKTRLRMVRYICGFPQPRTGYPSRAHR